MHVVGIMGSPRRDSNTDLLLAAAIRGAEGRGATTQTIRVCDMRIHPCVECYHCAEDGQCSIKERHGTVYDAFHRGPTPSSSRHPCFFYG